MNRTECAQRVVETGTNIALRRVANDYENLGELAIKAKQILHSRVELALKLALAANEAAREDGWGAIGGPRHDD